MNRKQIKQIRRTKSKAKRINIKRNIRRYSQSPKRPIRRYVVTREIRRYSGIPRVWYRWDLHSVSD